MAIFQWASMGGYAAFIWPAYAATFLILAFVLGLSWRSVRRLESQMKQAQQLRAARRPARAA